jgi:hypothetical protein
MAREATGPSNVTKVPQGTLFRHLGIVVTYVFVVCMLNRRNKLLKLDGILLMLVLDFQGFGKQDRSVL